MKNMMKLPKAQLWILLLSGVVLIGCGGGKSGSNSSAAQDFNNGPVVNYLAPTISSIASENNQATVSWTHSGTVPEGGYDIIVNGTNTGTQYRTSASSVVISGLDLSTSQCFIVEARFTQEEPTLFSRSEESCTTPLDQTHSAPAISSISAENNQATVSWTQSGTVPQGGYDIIVNGTNTGTQYRTSANSVVISGLDLSTSQCFVIEARFTQEEPALFRRSEQSCTTPPEQTHSAPAISNVSAENNQATVSWTQSGTAPQGGYDIIINGTNTGTQYRTNANSVVVSGLDLSTSQCFVIEARFTQEEPALFRRSEQSCTTPSDQLNPVMVLYVSPDEAAGSCSEITADFTTIASALEASTPGDTIRLLPGRYNTNVSFPHGGTVNQPITLTYTPTSVCAAGGERSAIIDCSNPGNVNCITINYGNITVDGLEVRSANYNGIKVEGHLNGTPDEYSYGCWGGYCASEGHYNTNGADNVVIVNNYVHDMGYDGIKVGHVNNIIIDGNEIYDTGKMSRQQGIDLVGAYNAIIRNNHIHDDADATMLIGLFAKGGSENILIENNYVANVLSPFAAIEVGGDTEWYNTRYTPADVSFDANAEILNDNNYNNNFINCSGSYSDGNCLFDNRTMAEARQVVVRGNVIVNSNPALSFRNVYEAKVYNNTAINSGWSQGLVKIWHDGNYRHNNAHLKFFNNLFYNDVGTPVDRVLQDKRAGAASHLNTEGFLFTNNLIFDENNSSPSMGMSETFAPSAEQMFVQPNLSDSYQLQVGSPAIDEGLDPATVGRVLDYETSMPFIDAFDNQFPVNFIYDIGAYEYAE